MMMKNCHTDVLAYHDEEVTLPQKERSEMRERRDSNRRRLEQGLERNERPKPADCRSQGSYAMRTMVQQPDRDYDVDDGVYFEVEKLKGPRGGDMSASDAKEMVLEALKDDSFDRPPEQLKNCVRVYYKAGYHVDVPVYRTFKEDDSAEGETHIELASTDWKVSDPLAVTDWFLDANRDKSPDTDNGGQLRRIVRLLKAFARSRPSWRDQIATGFMITGLVVERYSANAAREDMALYDTMVSIRDRLRTDLVIEHPTVAGETLTKGHDDSRAKFLREKLSWAIDQLAVLFQSDCSRERALKAWDKVFDTTAFMGRHKDDKAEDQKNAGTSVESSPAGTGTAPSLLTKGREEAATEKPVDKHGGGRYA